MVSRTSTRKWGGVAIGLALFPAISALESRVWAQYAPTQVAAVRDAEPKGKEAGARDLIRKAREAFQAGDYAMAEQYARQAKDLKTPLPFYEKDTPESILSEVAQAKAKAVPTDDPKAMLKAAREALAANRFDDAHALAVRADATGHKWKLFDDTPNRCLDDIAKSRAKSEKVESVKVLAEARRLYQANRFDEAESLCYRAEKMHGPYGFMEMGDRPQKLIAEIASARSKAKKSNLPPAPATAVVQSTDKVPPPSWDDAPKIQQVASRNESKPNLEPTSNIASGMAKQQAQSLMADGKVAMQAGRFTDARTKFLEAQAKFAGFRPDEDNPVRCLNNLTANVNRHVKEAVASGNEAQLVAAKKLCAEFKLDVQAVDARLAAMKQAVGTAVKSTSAVGQTLLDKARLEINRNQLQVARELANEVFNGPYSMKDEAAAVLRSIDAADDELKTATAIKSYEAGLAAYQGKDFVQALAIFNQIDAMTLPAEHQAKIKDLCAQCVQQTAAQNNVPSVEASAATPLSQPKPLGLPPAAPVVPPANSAMTAPAAPPAENLADQVRALQKVEFQRLREESNKVLTESRKCWDRGETDAAMEMLNGFMTKVKASQLEANEVGLLQRPIDQRIQTYKLVKSQKDFENKIVGRKAKHDLEATREVLAAERKGEQIKGLMKEFNRLRAEGKAREAELVAMKMKQLDPDDPAVAAVNTIANVNYNVQSAEEGKRNRENMFVRGMNNVENPGPLVDSNDPVALDVARLKTASERGKGIDSIHLKRSDAEKEIQHKLSTTVTLSFKGTPLNQVVEDLKAMTGINIITDMPALEEEKIALDIPVTFSVDNMKCESALKNLLGNLHLTSVIGDDALKITTNRKARGSLVQRVYRVADLVMPIEDYLQPETMNLERSIQRVVDAQRMNLGNGQTPFNNGRFMLPQGQQVGSNGAAMTNSPGQAGGDANRIMSQIGAPTSQKQTMHEMLIKLIQNTISPQSWADVGGTGTIDYMPIGMALVINQTVDVQEQVFELLEALRRLQDLQVAVEIKLITLSETFFERIGLDFNLNIKTDHSTGQFEPQFVTNQFAPAGQINDFRGKNVFAGLTPASGAQGHSFTSDLDIPIKSSSFQYAIPPFAYPNNPGFDGGLSMGLAFLSDIQVFMFMEAAQGDRRIHVMQAPKLTMFNGQSASISVQDQQFFVTNVGIVGFGGQIVFVPQNNPFPLGVEMTLQSVVSADRRFVRINTNVRLANLASANVPLFPVTTFITPVFEGGAQGQPIPFTQFIQQPQLSLVNIQTTVSIPDGGTVILGGLKTLSEGRNEFGPPVLSKLPYVNRLFKNVGFGREAQSLLVMVTPRIIINSEEETRQTGVISNPENQ